jgi:hypothetical protein
LGLWISFLLLDLSQSMPKYISIVNAKKTCSYFQHYIWQVLIKLIVYIQSYLSEIAINVLTLKKSSKLFFIYLYFNKRQNIYSQVILTVNYFLLYHVVIINYNKVFSLYNIYIFNFRISNHKIVHIKIKIKTAKRMCLNMAKY